MYIEEINKNLQKPDKVKRILTGVEGDTVGIAVGWRVGVVVG